MKVLLGENLGYILREILKQKSLTNHDFQPVWKRTYKTPAVITSFGLRASLASIVSQWLCIVHFMKARLLGQKNARDVVIELTSNKVLRCYTISPNGRYFIKWKCILL